MKFAALSCLLLLSVLPARAGEGPSLMRARMILSPDQIARLGALGYDIEQQEAQYTDLIVSDQELAELTFLGFDPVVVAYGRPFDELRAERGDSYPDLAAVEAEMAGVAAAFPSICAFVDLTTSLGMPPTSEGRHLYALKISDNVNEDENEPSMLVVSTHHARELVTPVIALTAIHAFTDNYGSDPTVTAIVDNNELWIAPVWNPDGYNEVFVGDNFWRKNRTVFPGGIGVDTNRNYRTGWSSGCGGSTSPSSETYRGPAPASESETQTLEAFTARERFARVIDFHSSGREALYAYLCLSHPQASWFHSEANLLASACGYGNSSRTPSADGEQYQWQLTHLACAFLVETHTEFQPPYPSAEAEALAVLPAIKLMAQRPAALWGTVTDNEGQPVSATISFAEINYSNGEQLTSGGPFGRYDAFVAPGTYQVHYQAKGFAEQILSVTLSNDSAVERNIVMSPEQFFCEGDFNQDRAIDVRDLAELINALGSNDLTYDLDHNGQINLADLDTALESWQNCAL